MASQALSTLRSSRDRSYQGILTLEEASWRALAGRLRSRDLPRSSREKTFTMAMTDHWLRTSKSLWFAHLKYHSSRIRSVRRNTGKKKTFTKIPANSNSLSCPSTTTSTSKTHSSTSLKMRALDHLCSPRTFSTILVLPRTFSRRLVWAPRESQLLQMFGVRHLFSVFDKGEEGCWNTIDAEFSEVEK